MLFYDNEGRKYHYDIPKEYYFDRGSKAKLYGITDKECLKVLNRDPENYFNEEVFNKIKNISLDSLVKLGVPFYTDGKIKAYTMEYFARSNMNILDMPTEYTLENLNKLYNDLAVLAKNNIETFDLYYRNAIVGDSKIKIIDFDSYILNKDSENALLHNVGNLLYTFRGLYREALLKKGIDPEKMMIDSMNAEKYLSYLFAFTGYKESPTKVLQRKLVGTKTPMELFDRKW